MDSVLNLSFAQSPHTQVCVRVGEDRDTPRTVDRLQKRLQDARPVLHGERVVSVCLPVVCMRLLNNVSVVSRAVCWCVLLAQWTGVIANPACIL